MPDRRRPRNKPPTDMVERDAVPVVPDHCHDTPRSTTRALAAVAVVATLVVAYLGWLQYRTNSRLAALEDYVADVRVLRDQQNRDVNDRINGAVCAIMDRLPAGPLLDPIREDYECGPGLVPAAMSEAQVTEILRDYGPAALARTPGEFYELFPPDPLGTGIPADEFGDVPDN
jgi:hypothetical protein